MKFWILRKFSNYGLAVEHYSILGLAPGAQKQQIREAYLNLAKKYHPDSATGDTEKFKKIAASYEFLNTNIKKPKNQGPEKTENNKKYYYDYENFNKDFSDDENEERWREEKTWTQGSQKDRMNAHGYEYYDPYASNSERYTYSQFKRDKYNKTYKNSKKHEHEAHGFKQDSNGNVFPFIFGLGTCSVFLKIMTSA